MFLATLAILTGQFDTGGPSQAVKPRKPRPVITGEALLGCSEVLRDIGYQFSLDEGFTEIRPKQPETPPDLRPPRFICGLVNFPPSVTRLSKVQKQRLKELYVQYLGSASILDQDISRELNLSQSQRSKLESIRSRNTLRRYSSTRPPSSLISTAKEGLSLFPPSYRIGSDRSISGIIQTTILFANWNNQVQHKQLATAVQARSECRALLTPAQTSRLKTLAGKPLSAVFVCTGAPLFLSGVKLDTPMAILRNDVSAKLGLKESVVDSLMFELSKLYQQAHDQADEYWWLMKEAGTAEKIANHRNLTFAKAESRARELILAFLTEPQITMWKSMSKPQTNQNHFGYSDANKIRLYQGDGKANSPPRIEKL